MALQALRNINKDAGNGDATKKPDSFPVMLQKFAGEIGRALPKHINPDRMARIALTAFRMTPKLGDCDPRSVFAAVIQSSQLGLEVGLMGEAHLVPYGSQCQLIPGYTGLMKLARQSGLVQDIYAHEVRLNDKFALKLGMERILEHEPMAAPGGFPDSDDARGPVIGFYAVAVFKDGSRTFVAMSLNEIERIRDNSKGYQAAKKYKKESVWDTDPVAMGLKTAIRRLCKYLPKSPELATALALDAAATQGKAQDLDLKDVIEGNAFVMADDESGEGDGQGNQGGQQREESNPPAGGKPKPRPDPKDKPPVTRLEQAIQAMEAATSVEALDEVYIRAEGDLDGADLEATMREYRRIKQRIESGGLI